jgi:hypothetical protein
MEPEQFPVEPYSVVNVSSLESSYICDDKLGYNHEQSPPGIANRDLMDRRYFLFPFVCPATGTATCLINPWNNR